MGDYKNFLFL